MVPYKVKKCPKFGKNYATPHYDIPENWLNYYQMELNLPRSCFNIHRLRDGLNGDKAPFDVNKLFEQVQADINDPEKEPCIVIGMAGTEGGLDDKVTLSTYQNLLTYRTILD